MAPHVRRAIEEFSIQEVTRTEQNGNVTVTTRTLGVTLSKSKDKEMLSKHHKLLTDKVEMSGGLTTFTDWLSEAEGKAIDAG